MRSASTVCLPTQQYNALLMVPADDACMTKNCVLAGFGKVYVAQYQHHDALDASRICGKQRAECPAQHCRAGTTTAVERRQCPGC
jgi:hypothetical protein